MDRCLTRARAFNQLISIPSFPIKFSVFGNDASARVFKIHSTKFCALRKNIV